jgi:hypothetical protein
MNYTDKQLKQALADMLPQSIYNGGELYIYEDDFAGLGGYRHVRDTELLHLCWLVEEELPPSSECDYFDSLSMRSSWQQRVAALAVLKGIEI